MQFTHDISHAAEPRLKITWIAAGHCWDRRHNVAGMVRSRSARIFFTVCRALMAIEALRGSLGSFAVVRAVGRRRRGKY